MKFYLPVFVFLSIAFHSLGQNSPEGNIDPNEIRYYQGKPYDKVEQQKLRSGASWQSFLENNGTWYVHFNEISGMPHRAYGKPLEVGGNSLEAKALLFAEQQLNAFSIPTGELVSTGKEIQTKYAYVNFRQYHENLLVIGSRYTVKFHEGKIIMFGCDVHPAIDVNLQPSYSLDEAAVFATANLSNEVLTTMSGNSMEILPIPFGHQFEYHLVYDIMVRTMSSEGIPANYQTYVDAHTGEILSRRNTVSHFDKKGPGNPKGQPVQKPVEGAGMLQVTATVEGPVYENNPYENIVTQPLENIYITVTGTNYLTDLNGTATLPVNPGSTGTVRLMGPWCRVYTDNVTPSTTVELIDGQNNIVFGDDVSTIRERSAYRSVQTIHDFHRIWMPSNFDEMDYQLTTNIDEAGTCNAFYDGNSINFYNLGGGCNASSLVADVCHHEYGHGINDKFYQSIGGTWVNGAMGEGYADFWALAANDTPLLGVGFNTADMEPIRRYDQDPKIYPSDISGEVHGDGEIIMGAWWDTHLLLGADWNITLPLFVEAYQGLQAEAANGNEGDAYTDVLIDVLQADDDDGDISNGTPNGNEIIDAFYIHGITLISNATLEFAPFLFTTAETTVPLEVYLSLEFPFTQYVSEVVCHYKINDATWNEVEMEDEGSGSYIFNVSGQPAGTVIAHYFSASDINGSLGAVIPIGAHLSPFPNLPYFTLVDVSVLASHDGDEYADFGNWVTGIPEDDASTGEWEEDTPIGSYTTTAAAGTMVQPDEQHTPGGDICFITQNAANAQAGIGDSDVDDGKTTLQTPSIDMSNYLDPVVAYWRYYTNSPPGGANPGQDYWQVRISNDNGASWTYVENTKTSDMSWRRNAFHVSDFVTPTDEMKFQFIAADSTRLGENLDGGSLVEAAVDDFVIYEALIIGVDEEKTSEQSFTFFPNPAQDQIRIQTSFTLNSPMQLQIFDALGSSVFNLSLNSMRGDRQQVIALPPLSNGVYSVVLSSEGFLSQKQLLIAH